MASPKISVCTQKCKVLTSGPMCHFGFTAEMTRNPRTKTVQIDDTVDLLLRVTYLRPPSWHRIHMGF